MRCWQSLLSRWRLARDYQHDRATQCYCSATWFKTLLGFGDSFYLTTLLPPK
jgi:hypothetical protein